MSQNAKLLSRERISSQSLTSIVEKSQTRQPPFQEYELRLNSTQLDINPVSKPTQYVKPISPDEGFESDIDTVSLISSDDSFTSSTCLVDDHVLKHRENDSANGSASSDSDTETVIQRRHTNESYPIVDVLCYTDVKFPKILVFCIKDEVLVFSFENIDNLQQFYTSFNTLKAVTNQRTYGNSKNLGTKFNLLHRTDNNGVTHIEISRENNANPMCNSKLVYQNSDESSSIISLNTPDIQYTKRLVGDKQKITEYELKTATIPSNDYAKKAETLRYVRQSQKTLLKSLDDSKINLHSELKSSRSEFFPSNFETGANFTTLNQKLEKNVEDATLKKVWKSAEDLLEPPKRPERKRKPKGKAPPPPVLQQQETNKQNVMKGQYVRVSVEPKKSIMPRLDEPHIPSSTTSSSSLSSLTNFQTFSNNVQTFSNNAQTFSNNIQTFTPNWNNVRQPQSPLVLSTSNKPKVATPKTFLKASEVKKASQDLPIWTNSVPRLLKKPRSKSETRNLTPMAYRYIDTTRSHPVNYSSNTGSISNRLFGLSQKLKEFGTNVVSQPNARSFNSFYDATDSRRNSIGEMTYKSANNESTLKSVIKKQDDKRGKHGSEQKKVTFSAYATVQVL